MPSRPRRRWRSRLARLTELLLAVAGFAHLLVGSDPATAEALFLLGWNAVAVTYLIVGARHVRRHMTDGESDVVHNGLRSQRFSFLFTVAASLTGLSAALDVVSGFEGEIGPVIEGLSVVTVICAWLLLHVGYARFYSAWDGDGERQGFAFPETDRPGFVDYLYFSVTLGVSFATSDVTVRQRPLRWHVLVHSVASFLYNAIVLAVGVGVLTGR